MSFSINTNNLLIFYQLIKFKGLVKLNLFFYQSMEQNIGLKLNNES